jgi:hypothetical protein
MALAAADDGHDMPVAELGAVFRNDRNRRRCSGWM